MPKARAAGWLLAPFAAGAFLRLWNVAAQVASGDELHAVRAVLSGRPWWQILFTFELSDNCPPLSALYAFLHAHGAPPTEWLFRLPVLAASLAALVALPLLARRLVEERAAAIFAWLLALSPILTLYSRIIRPYGIVALVSFLAAAAFWEWWQRRRPAAAAAYVVCATLCAFFHLGTAPFVVAPFLFAAGALVAVRRPARPGLWAIVALGLSVVAGFASFLVPAWPSLSVLIANKKNPLELSWAEAGAVLELQAGGGRVLAAAFLWALALWGLGHLFRRDAPLAAFTATLAAGQLAGLIVLAPEMLGHPLVLDRYLIPMLPLVLLWAAAGLADLTARLGARAASASAKWRGAVGPAAAALAVVALALAGPFADPAYWRSPFVHHNDYVAFFCPRASLPAARIPRFYRETLATAPPGALLEFPWIPLWSNMRAFYVYQEAHGRDVLVAEVPIEPGWRQLSFRNLPLASPEGFLASRARFLVVHWNLLEEERAVTPHCWPLFSQMKEKHQRILLNQGRRMAGALLERWGAPDEDRDGVAVWDLARLRQAGLARR